jgi:hypothetical protein
MPSKDNRQIAAITQVAALMSKHLMTTNPTIDRMTLSIIDTKYEFGEEEGDKRDTYLATYGKHYDFMLMAYVSSEFAEEYLRTVREHRVSVHWPQRTAEDRRDNPPETIETVERAMEINRNGNFHAMAQLRASEIAYLLLSGDWSGSKLAEHLKKSLPEHRQLINKVLWPFMPQLMIVSEGWEQRIDELLTISAHSEFDGHILREEGYIKYSAFSPEWLCYASVYERRFDPASNTFSA